MSPRYLIIDTETNGLPPRAKKGEPPIPADDPRQPRLASITMLVTTPDLEVDYDRSLSALIKPDGWIMPPETAAINGLTMDALERDGIPVLTALTAYSEFVMDNWVVVAHNAQFDTKIMRGELRRANMPDLFHETLNICTQRATVDILKMAPTNAMMATGRYGFKAPKLMECYQHFYGHEFDGAHTSDADARACLMVLRKLIELGKCPEPSVRTSSFHD